MRYFLLFMLLINLLQAQIVDITDLKETKLSNYMSYLKLEKNENISPYEINSSKDFQEITNPNLGLIFENNIWTKVKLKNSSEKNLEIFLLNNIPLTEKIDIFIFENDKLIKEKTIGSLYGDKNLSNRFNSFELSINPHIEYTILTKIYNPKGRVDVEWIAMSKDVFYSFIYKDTLIWGLIFGIFFILFVLLFVFYFILKNKSFLNYIFYILFFGVYLFVNNGFSKLLFDYGNLDLILSHISGYSIVIFYVLFLDEYLNLSKNKKYPILLKIIYLYGLYLALTSWVIIFSPIVYSFDNYYFVFTLLTLFILLFITTKESIKAQDIPLFYIFGQLCLIFGYLFLLLSSFQFIPVKASNQQFLGIFTSLEIIFFTIAIFSKIKITIDQKEKNEKLILSQSHFSTIGQTLKNIAHQWKVPTVRLGTLITELESTLYKENISNERIDKIFVNMRNSSEFMRDTIDEFSNFYSNKITQNTNFKIFKEINDVKLLLIEKMRFLNFKIIYDDKSIEDVYLYGNSRTFAHICMIIIDNAIDMSKQRDIKNPFIKISTKSTKKELIINFEDNCGGIVQKPINKIFELEVSSHEEKNRGIGLSIAKMLIEHKMRGKIEVNNIPNGAVFKLILSQK